MALEATDPETYSLIGAAMAVHRELGRGFLESVYHEALEIEFNAKKIPYKREVEIPVFYRGQKLNKNFRADFICFDSIILELKAISKLTSKEEGQIINYLNASKLDRGLIINFGSASLEFQRYNNSENFKQKADKIDLY